MGFFVLEHAWCDNCSHSGESVVLVLLDLTAGCDTTVFLFIDLSTGWASDAPVWTGSSPCFVIFRIYGVFVFLPWLCLPILYHCVPCIPNIVRSPVVSCLWVFFWDLTLIKRLAFYLPSGKMHLSIVLCSVLRGCIKMSFFNFFLNAWFCLTWVLCLQEPPILCWNVI